MESHIYTHDQTKPIENGILPDESITIAIVKSTFTIYIYEALRVVSMNYYVIYLNPLGKLKVRSFISAFLLSRVRC